MPRAGAQTITRAIGFADIVDRVKPAVISVRVKIDAGKRTKETSPFSKDSPLDRFYRRFGQPDTPEGGSAPRGRNFVTGQGSGFFISADGYAVTNFHVVDKADNVEVTADDGRIFTAKVIGADQRSDVALIKVDGAGTLPFVRFAETSPRIGDWVLAVGNPFGLGGTVTAGIISARGRDIGAGPYDDFIQIDAAVNRGNSGGPTFDIEGNVIGVNSAIVSPTGGSVGIAFAIPADTVKAVVTQLKENGKVTRGWIGVQIQEVTPDLAEDLGLKAPRGALVAEPQAGAPAAKAGIESGDVIVAVNGKEARDFREVARTISNLAPGTTAAIGVIRKGQEKTFNIVLGNLPDQREANANAGDPEAEGHQRGAARRSGRPRGRRRRRHQCGSRRGRGRAGVPGWRRHSPGGRQESRIGRRASQRDRCRPEVREAYGGDAGEIRGRHQVRRGAGRSRLIDRIRAGAPRHAVANFSI